MDIPKLQKPILNHKHILGFGLTVLAIANLAILLIDIINLGDARKLIIDLEIPFMWNLLFQEAGMIEIFQWMFLGSFALISAYVSGILKERSKVESSLFWSWFSVAGVLMLIEDTVDIRNFFLRGRWAWEWQTLNVLETIYFLLLAAIPIYAVLRYGRAIKESRITVILLMFGFFFYGGAAFISGPADLTSFNYHLGNVAYDSSAFLGGEELRELYNETDERMMEEYGDNYMHLRYRLVDFYIEESLEFLGSLMLLASAFAYLDFLCNNRED